MKSTYKIKNKCRGADFNSYVFVFWLYYYKTCNILDMPIKAIIGMVKLIIVMYIDL